LELKKGKKGSGSRNIRTKNIRALGILKVLALIILALLTLLTLLAVQTFVVAAAEEQDLRAALLNLSNAKEEMLNAGLGVARISDLISEGFMYLSYADYNKTREIISAAHNVRDLAFKTQKELALVKQLFLDAQQSNITMMSAGADGSTGTRIDLGLNYSQREFEKENYEEALQALGVAKKIILESITSKYATLKDSLSALEKKTEEFGLSKYRLTNLQGLLPEALATGKIDELEIIEKEIGQLSKGVSDYEETKLSIPALESRQLSAQVIEDGLEEARAYLNVADYNSALNKLETLKEMISTALKLDEEAAEFEKTLNDEKAKYATGFSFSETEALLAKARYELSVGNYAEAEQQLGKARKSLESRKAEFLVKNASRKSPLFSLKEFISKNWPYISAVLFIAIILILLSHKAIAYSLRKKKLASLEKELRVSEKQVQELQRSYFIHKKMSRESYDDAYDVLQDKITSLKERISLLHKKISKMDASAKRSKKVKKPEGTP